MLISSGDIKMDYDVIKVVFGFSSVYSSKGVNTIYQKALDSLESSAKNAGADGLINIGFQNRVAVGQTCMGGSKQVLEVFAWGTAIKLK